MEVEDGVGLAQQQLFEHEKFDVSSPLRGVVLCCTSIPADKRTEMAMQAEQMGAQHKYDLTSEVTHLIVGDYDTPKYRYVAKERPDVKVLKPEWIEAVRQLWIHDQPIDMEMLEKKNELATFAGLRVCMTGFEDPTERQRIVDMVVSKGGGDYHGDLTKQVTHLVTCRPEGAKYKHAKAWGLRLVSLEWLQDSLDRGMILDEKLYNPEFPPDQRGRGAWNRKAITKSPLGKRSRDNNISSLEEGRRKLRRTTSTKLMSQNENIWGDIVGGGGTIEAANSFAYEITQNEMAQTRAVASKTIAQAGSSSGYIFPETSEKRATFHGCKFHIHGFDRRKSEVLTNHILSHGGQIYNLLDDFVRLPRIQSYIIIPHSFPVADLTTLPKEVLPTQLITDLWVERCLESKEVIDPVDYPLGRPFPKLPVEGFAGFTICSTAFVGMQLRHLSMAAVLVGAKYEESFTPDASVLIYDWSRPMRSDKLLSAKEWRVPVVSIDWLLDSIKDGTRLALKPYIQRKKVAKPETTAVQILDTDSAIFKGAADVREQVIGHPSSPAQQNLEPRQGRELDTTAFDHDSPLTLADDSILTLADEDSSLTLPISRPSWGSNAEPLREISPNCSQKQHPSPLKQSPKQNTLQKDISTAITSLFAKSKQTYPNNSILEPSNGGRKKRAPTRILGRAASNVSNGSVRLSRASSVDSTASHGNPVAWPSVSAFREQGAAGSEHDTQPPPATQRLGYEDEESKEYKAQVIARITGEKITKKEKERSITVGSALEMGETARSRKMRSLRDRGTVGGGLR